MMLPDLPKFLNRKEAPVAPATPEERAELAAKPVHQDNVVATIMMEAAEKDAAVAAEIDAKAERLQKARTAARIAKLKTEKELKLIPEKYRAWDPKTSKWYDTRKGKPNMTQAVHINDLHKSNHPKAVANEKSWDKVTKAKKPAKGKTAARAGSKTEKRIAMLKRANGASIAELLKATFGGKGKTPEATMAAILSKGGAIGKAYNVKAIGDGQGKDRRYKI